MERGVLGGGQRVVAELGQDVAGLAEDLAGLGQRGALAVAAVLTWACSGGRGPGVGLRPVEGLGAASCAGESESACPGLAAAPLAVGLPIPGMTKPGPLQDESDRCDLVGLKSIDEVGGAAAIRQRGIPFHRVTHPLATDRYQPASLTQPAARALKIGPAASRVCRRQTWAATQRWSGRGKPWGDNGHSDS